MGLTGQDWLHASAFLAPPLSMCHSAAPPCLQERMAESQMSSEVDGCTSGWGEAQVQDEDCSRHDGTDHSRELRATGGLHILSVGLRGVEFPECPSSSGSVYLVFLTGLELS